MERPDPMDLLPSVHRVVYTGDSNSGPPDQELGTLTKELASQLLALVTAGFSTVMYFQEKYKIGVRIVFRFPGGVERHAKLLESLAMVIFFPGAVYLGDKRIMSQGICSYLCHVLAK